VKRVLYTLPLLVLIFTLVFIHSGCEKTEDPVTPVDENIDKETVASKDMAALTNLLTSANSFLWRHINTGSLTGCPNVAYDSSFGTLRVNYGSFPGCAPPIDGLTRSGLYSLTYFVTPALDSFQSFVSFTDFRIYKYTTTPQVDTNVMRVTGFMNFSSKKNADGSFTFRAGGTGGFATNTGLTKTIESINLVGQVNFNNVNIITDDVHSVYGNISFNNGEGNLYSVSITQANALQINGNCRYPLFGTLRVTNTGVDCDFSPNANACDAIAKFTKGSFTKTVDFTNIDW
jgi:hypothetical protein